MAEPLQIETGISLPLFLWLPLAAILAVLVVSAVLFWQVTHRHQPDYTARQPNGQKMQLVPHDTPSLQSSNLLRWASRAAVAAYTFDFVNYEKQAAIAHQYFTDSGWTDYQQALTGPVKSIVAKQLFVNGVVAGTPVIAVTDADSWTIQLPFLVTYQSSDQATRQNFLVKMKVVRVPTWQNEYGIGIDSFVMGGSG